MVNEERVKSVRLTTGEEFIAEIEDNGDSVKVKSPCMVKLAEMEDGRIGMSMPPWFGFSKSTEFTISKDHILAMGEPLDDLKAGYVQSNSNIVLPNAGGGLVT